MDCLKTYNHFYKKAQNVSKRMIIAKMRQAKLKNRPFSTIHNNITRDLHHYINDNYTNNLCFKKNTPIMMALRVIE